MACFLAAGVASLCGAPVSTLVSTSPQTSASAGGASYQPVISANGQFVAFVSQAKNLATNAGPSRAFNVYVWDRESGDVSLVSAATNGLVADGHCLAPSISADGRFIAFQSTAGNLAARDTNGLSDVFLRDRLASTTELVSRGADGFAPRGRASIAPLLSRDGRRLIFESGATNFAFNNTNSVGDVIVFDRESGGRALVSVNAAGNASQAGSSGSAAISPDGNWVVYVNWTSNSMVVTGHVYARNLQTATTHWASSNASVQLPGFLGAHSPALSADGSAVWFFGYNATTTNLYRVELAGGQTVLVSGAAQSRSEPAPSADGRYVAYEQNNLVRVWDAQTQAEVVASVTTSGQPAPFLDGPARPALSSDGRIVTFLSSAGGVTGDPTNGLTQLFQRDLAAGRTRLLSGDANGQASEDLSAVIPAVTPDGSRVAFESTSANLLPDDWNDVSDVFLHDVNEESLTLVSRRHASRPSFNRVAAATLYPHAFSLDGRYLAFGSLDRDFAANDTNGFQDIFIRDLTTGSEDAISVSAAGAFTNTFPSRDCVLSADGRRIAWVTSKADPGGNWLHVSSIDWRDRISGETRRVVSGGAFQNEAPTISSDGRWVAFQTTLQVTQFEPGLAGLSSGFNVVLQDVLAGTNYVVSRSAFGPRAANGESDSPQFSPDGRWLAFGSRATDITFESVSGRKLLVRDLVNNQTIDVSVGPYLGGSDLFPIYLGRAIFSGDSRFLAFNTFNLGVGLFDLNAGTRSNVCFNCENPTMSQDGTMLAVSLRNWIAGRDGVRLLDRRTGRSSTFGPDVSTSPPNPIETILRPLLSGDGRFLVFQVRQPNGTSLPTPRYYLRDLARGLTVPLPIDGQGGFGDDASYSAQFAADGRTLALVSFASDLVAGDYNRRQDVFAVRIGSPDADQDGLDDDWEMAYFNALTRDGAGDFDQDGHSDREEFLAGTDPTDEASVLSVVVVASVPANKVTLIWNSIPGRSYDVQFKDSLTNNWSTLFSGVVAASITHSVVENNLPPRRMQRYYRVVLAP